MRDLPLATEADWLGFIVDDVAHHYARTPDITRYLRLIDLRIGRTAAMLAAVTTRRLFDASGRLCQVC